MAEPTAMQLATEAEKLAQEELKRKKKEEQDLLAAYSTESGDIYGTAKGASEDLLGGARSDIESLYGQGYSDLESLIGEQAGLRMQESLRPIEGQLARQGLLGGPSGALNEALAGAAERVYTEGLGKLQDYVGKRTGALADLFGTQASQRMGLEQQYGGQMQGLLAQALAGELANTQAGLDIATQYGLKGLEGALGANRITLETAAEKDIAQERANIGEETAATNLALRQREWDNNYYSLVSSLYSQYRQAGQTDSMATGNARTEALRQMGARPTV